MRLKELLPLIIAALLLVLPAAAQEGAEEELQAAADSWLTLIDGADFDGSWEMSGQLMKDSVTPEQWKQALETVQVQMATIAGEPVDLTQREYVEAQILEDVQDLPEGEYAAVRYRTEQGDHMFAEVVTLKREDGDWDVVGYFVTPEAE